MACQLHPWKIFVHQQYKQKLPINPENILLWGIHILRRHISGLFWPPISLLSYDITLTPVYHSHFLILLHKWPLLYVCYKPKKNVVKHAHINVFFTRINPWKFGGKKIKTDKVIQCLLKDDDSYKVQKVHGFNKSRINLSILIFFSPNFQRLILVKNAIID